MRAVAPDVAAAHRRGLGPHLRLATMLSTGTADRARAPLLMLVPRTRARATILQVPAVAWREELVQPEDFDLMGG